jgi:uncharacterized integral membrane protein
MGRAVICRVAALGVVRSFSPNDKDLSVPFDIVSSVLLLVVVVTLTAALQFDSPLGWFSLPLIVGIVAV